VLVEDAWVIRRGHASDSLACLLEGLHRGTTQFFNPFAHTHALKVEAV
jgi:hypothetical protein